MSNHINFGCLGLPVLLDSLGDPVAIRTRKAAAIVGYLSRVPGMSIGREALADLLWSDAPRLKAMQSLRQALKQVREAERMAGEQLLISRSGHVSLDPSKFRSDLDKVMALVKGGRGSDFKQATELWRGDLFLGCDDLDPVFSDWLGVERERIRTEVFSASFQHLNGKAENDGGERLEAGAGFLLHIDPACEPAHQVLIRLYMSLGQRERAQQQLQACARELRAALDAEPDEETKALLLVSETDVNGSMHAAIGGQSYGNTIKPQLSSGAGEIGLPKIMISSKALTSPDLDDARFLKDEIIAGLSSYRSFDLYNDFDSDEDMTRPVAVHGDSELGHYLLRFNFDERTAKVSVQFEDQLSGQIVFNEIVDLTKWDSVPVAASQTASRVHWLVVRRLCNPSNTSAFAMWCQADSLLWQFSPTSDLKAMKLLDELEQRYPSFSMTYAGRASVIMKQELYYPLSERTTAEGMDSILDLAERAVMLDPWQAVNQRVYGWTLIQSRQAEDACRSFQNARQLCSADPSNLMSVAEGLAFCGEIKEAKAVADQAFSRFSFVPRVFYEYLANIFFAADDFDNAVSQLDRGSGFSLGGLTTRVAALLCSGKESEARSVLMNYKDNRERLLSNVIQYENDPSEWRRRVNLFQQHNTRLRYDQGAQLVQNFLFDGVA